MKFRTVGDAVKYFADVDRRLAEGTLNPTCSNYSDDVTRLRETLEDMKKLTTQSIMEGGLDTESMLYLVDSAQMFAQLLGKMQGFDRGVKFLLARSGSAGEYLI